MAQLTTGTGDGGLRVEVDEFGAFGSAVGSQETGNAFYDPVGDIEEAGTVFESGVALRVGDTGERTFLTSGAIGTSGNLLGSGFDRTDETNLSSSFSVEGLDFVLEQAVADTLQGEQRVGSLLTQTYTITNPGNETLEFELVRYFDGDLDFDGSLIDGGGRLFSNGQETLFETDSAGDPSNATTFVGITGEGGALGGESDDGRSTNRFEIDSFSGLRDRLIAGTALDDIIENNGQDVDANDDGFVDEGQGFDITLALRNTFELEPGASTTYTTTTTFGSGAPLPLEAVDDEAETVQETAVSVEVLVNDTSFNGVPILLDSFDAASEAGGTLTLDNNDTPDDASDDRLIYTPPAGFTGSDTFSYTISDGGNTDTATVRVTVIPPSDFQTNSNLTAAELAALLVGEGIEVTNPTLTGAEIASGSFVNGTEIGLGIDAGIILSSGDIAIASGPNDQSGAGSNLGQPGDNDLDAVLQGEEGDTDTPNTNDSSVLEFDFVSQEPEVFFQYIFASEEYNEFVGSQFNDVFGFFLNGENIALVPGDITPVAINNVNLEANAGFFLNNDFSAEAEDEQIEPPFDTQFDGLTTILNVQAIVEPGVPQRLKLAIADTADSILDSAVFIAGGTLSTTFPAITEVDLELRANEVLEIVPQEETIQGQVQVEFSLTASEQTSGFVNEIVAFVVDDETGTINGVAPGAADYQDLALNGSQSRVIYSALSNDLLAGETLVRQLSFNVGQQLGFALLTNTTLDALQVSPFSAQNVFFSFPAANFDGQDRLRGTEIDEGVFQFAWEDNFVNTGLDDDFDDVVFTARLSSNAPERGTRIQGQPTTELFDLRGLGLLGEENFSFEVRGDADFSNFFGLYEVENPQGAVLDEVTGNLLLPDAPGYATAAVRQRLVAVDEDGVVTFNRIGNGLPRSEVDGLYAPFMIANASPQEFLDATRDNIFNDPSAAPAAYFPYLSANFDGQDHLRLLGDNTFAFEDLPQLGDVDFNDFVVTVNVI